METIPPTTEPVEPVPMGRVPLLHPGDKLTAEEFLRRYAAMPELKKAELIEGVVYMPSPVRNSHAGSHFDLISWLGFYRVATPGVVGGDNGTLRLDLDNVPQPDAFLRILQTHGGQARVDKDGYITGAPDWVGGVALSSVSMDLHGKLHVYRRNGVREYLVWRVEDRAIDWFVLREGRFEPLKPNPSGILQSQVLPGLWLDADALIR